jgi:hypothetical protein
MNNDWPLNAILQWQGEGIKLNPPCTEDILRQAEKKLSFNFPDSFKKLYLIADGFKDDDWRENMFSIWPINRILIEFHQRQDERFVGFADFLINSHALGFYKDLDGIYKDVDRYLPVASTFEECIEFINVDSPNLY